MPEVITQSVGGKFVAVVASFQRPANTTAYTAGDVVSNSISATVLMKFANAARLVGGSGAVVKARLVTDNASDTSTYRLVLYTRSEAYVTVPVDNAPDTTLYANKDKKVGFLDFPALTSSAGSNTAADALWTGGVGSTTEPSGPLPVVCDGSVVLTGGAAPGDTALYGKLVSTSGGTPTSGQNFWVELTVLQN